MEGLRSVKQPLKLDTALVERVLVKFIKEEVGSAGLSKGVVGLSGGVDSAVVCSLAARALGPENVLAVIMPYRTSSNESIKDAEAVIKQSGVRYETVDITPMSDAFIQINGDMDNVRKGNILARMRMIVLYDRSARERALVLGTSNKSELLVGYGTIYGDLASAINPLGDLYKTQVWDLARHLGLPKTVIEKKPSADLWEGQTDEDEIGLRYAELDRLLYFMIDERRDDHELVKLGFEKQLIGRVREMVRRSQFKRRMPLIAKVSHRTINVDFRYVRDWGV